MRVTLIAAQSVDGFITRHEEPGTAFTSAADKQYFSRVLRAFDCSVFGSATYRVSEDSIRRGLNPSRRRVVLTRRPEAYATAAVPGQLEFTAETPRALTERLRAAGHRHCALLGGGMVHHLFLREGLVHELWLTLEPKVFGTGTSLVEGSVDVSLRLLEVERFPASDTLLVKYAVASTGGAGPSSLGSSG